MPFERGRTNFWQWKVWTQCEFQRHHGDLSVKEKREVWREKRKVRIFGTAILYWTYPDELPNDPSFRVNQKWMAVKPHVAVRKWQNIAARFCDLVRLAVWPVNSDFDIFIRILPYLNNQWREDARKLSRPRHGHVNTKTTTGSSEAWSLFFFFFFLGPSEPKRQWLGLFCAIRLKSMSVRF